MEHQKARFFRRFVNFSKISLGRGRDTEDFLEGYMEGIPMVGEGEAGHGKV